MSLQTKIEMHEIHIEEAKRIVALADALERLQKNKDFDLIVSTGYLQNEASRLVLLKGSPTQYSDENQDLLDRRIIGIGQFNEYLRNIYQLAGNAEKAIHDHNESINELLAEESGV